MHLFGSTLRSQTLTFLLFIDYKRERGLSDLNDKQCWNLWPFELHKRTRCQPTLYTHGRGAPLSRKKNESHWLMLARAFFSSVYVIKERFQSQDENVRFRCCLPREKSLLYYAKPATSWRKGRLRRNLETFGQELTGLKYSDFSGPTNFCRWEKKKKDFWRRKWFNQKLGHFTLLNVKTTKLK